ncbi:MAG: hypothetical protein KKH70_20870, partial [Gammaproteobacteria bacterium]|nr:hypothetical protein [Gammaproteobacteria bacterium]
VYCLADYHREPRAFWIEAITSDGWFRWNFSASEVDAMYRRQMQAFVDGGEAPSLGDGQAVERMLEDVRNETRHCIGTTGNRESVLGRI